MESKPKTFREKLVEYYVSQKIGCFNCEKLFAFAFTLHAINYKYGHSFCAEIADHSIPKIQNDIYGLLKGIQDYGITEGFFKGFRYFGKTVFFTFLDLDIKLSKHLRDKVSVMLPKNQGELFMFYCGAYFVAIREHRLEEIMQYNKFLREHWFDEEARKFKSRWKDRQEELAALPDPDPLFPERRSPYAQISLCTRLKFVSIPMGGMNKRY